MYLAHDLRHERPSRSRSCVLNSLRRSVPSSASYARSAPQRGSSTQHILPVLDSGEAHGQLWYTMPYVEGESLRDRLEREIRLPVEEAVRLVRATADALEYAHAHGIVHRDIKPENILLSAGHVRVADFGIAKALEMAGGETSHESGLLIGTPAYMSPEQAAGEHELDGRTDIYSLGCVLYELLAGEPLWSGPTPLAVIGRRFAESPSSLEATRAGLPAGLNRWSRRRWRAHPLNASGAPGTSGMRSPWWLGPPAGAVRPGRRSSPATAPSLRRHRGLPVALSALALGLLLGLGALFVWLRSDPGSAGGARHRLRLLAVLPFENLGDSTQAYFAEGVSNAVRASFAALPGLRVIAGASSSELPAHDEVPAADRARARVRYLLVGTVLRQGGSGEQFRRGR